MAGKPTRVFVADLAAFREAAMRILMQRRERLMLSNFKALSPAVREALLKKFPGVPRQFVTNALFDLAVEKSLVSQDRRENESAVSELSRQYQRLVTSGAKTPERIISARIGISPNELMARLKAHSTHPTSEIEIGRGPVTEVIGGFMGPAKRKRPNRRSRR